MILVEFNHGINTAKDDHASATVNYCGIYSRHSVSTQSASKQVNHSSYVQYIPRNMHTVFALLCFVVVVHWLIVQYPSGLLHWHGGNLTIAPVPAKQPWWIWINSSFEFIMNDWITTTKQSTTKPCAYFLGYTVGDLSSQSQSRSMVGKMRDAVDGV